MPSEGLSRGNSTRYVISEPTQINSVVISIHLLSLSYSATPSHSIVPRQLQTGQTKHAHGLLISNPTHAHTTMSLAPRSPGSGTNTPSSTAEEANGYLLLTIQDVTTTQIYAGEAMTLAKGEMRYVI
jgi:hypothetical protein